VLRDACVNNNIPAHFPVVGTLIGMHFGTALNGRTPQNFEEAKTTDEALYARVFHALLSNGIALPPGAYEALFVGMAHTDDIIERIGDIANSALAGVNA
jgi:glutamate-1-semialdehyde 2,1-aminomutase